ncbi:hypothetical protein GOV07_05995 [Candidatus Woesearchaeota archaeon]|nr:hypothetical protein [Candidatus Woesearchaeota archaeon]
MVKANVIARERPRNWDDSVSLGRRVAIAFGDALRKNTHPRVYQTGEVPAPENLAHVPVALTREILKGMHDFARVLGHSVLDTPHYMERKLSLSYRNR